MPAPSGATAAAASRPHGRRARAVTGQPRAQHEADRGERALGVPVGDRLLEPAAGAARALEVDQAGQQTAGQAVADHQRGAGGERGLDQPQDRRGAQRADRQQQRADVQHQALDVLGRRPTERRPRNRCRAPDGHQHEAGERQTPGEAAGQRGRAGERERQHERPHDEGGDQARLAEVAAGEEGQGRRGDQQTGRGGGGHGTAHDGVRLTSSPVTRRRLAVLIAALALAAPGTALAQSAGDEQYQDPFAGDDQSQSGDSQGDGSESAQATPTPAPAAPSQAPAPTAAPAPAVAAVAAASAHRQRPDHARGRRASGCCSAASRCGRGCGRASGAGCARARGTRGACARRRPGTPSPSGSWSGDATRRSRRARSAGRCGRAGRRG